MLTRLVKTQLAIFTIASIVGIGVMAVRYLNVPAFVGIGRITVTLELPAGGGLYQFSNVTYRGVKVGEVTQVGLTSSGAKATLSLTASPEIPADLRAEVRSMSAVGEQYVDLFPRQPAPPYLRDGSVIRESSVTIPQPVGPLLDNAAALLDSVPRGTLAALLDESATAFSGTGYDIGSLVDSAARLSADTNSTRDPIRQLIDDSGPLLDSLSASGQDTRDWSRQLALVTQQLRDNDPQIRDILAKGPPAFEEVTALLGEVKPTLPVLLANMTSLGQVAVTYNPSLEQVLVLLPSFLGGFDQISPSKNATGLPLGNFRLQASDPPACTVGFLPPSQWRSPADTTTLDTPDDLYCKLPQDSPIAVRGARNLPCMGHPGKRAPTVEICDSPMPYQPLAMRQHALGPNPIDPNLIAQGIPPDDRIEGGEEITAPVEGTLVAPPIPGAGPPAGPPSAPPGTAPAAAPSSAGGNAERLPIAVAPYDPRTGRYIGDDGLARTQTDLVTPASPRTWQDVVLPTNTGR
ncbi:MlaD family protein [Mycobacterium sp. 236(2023)]|uniref:MCE family protein n=1 Tax=Mycobacterium sp. 236(2023) TaxID=3038163 RepID=UPI0024157885|nr:MlaD family protein [Mycobacterium sp. 236(2023)]MDG4669264.1 MlaD family protein [Mycobacterium sp. 236(2023)]